jgi:hypothetical protein
MALDPRLASPQLLALAAMRLKQRQGTPSDPYAVTWLDEYTDDLTQVGDSPSGIFLPRKAASIEAWYTNPFIAAMRAKLAGGG